MTATKVDPEALQALKTEVLRVHGKLRGALKDEVSTAVRDRASQLATEEDRDE